MQQKAGSMRIVEVGDKRGEAVKCIDIRKNAESEGSLLKKN